MTDLAVRHYPTPGVILEIESAVPYELKLAFLPLYNEAFNRHYDAVASGDWWAD